MFNRKRRIFLALTLIAASAFGFGSAANTAHAESWWDRIQDVYYMPEEVERMQERLAESIQASEEAARRFEETQRQLLSENEALRERNAQLEARLEAANAELEARLRAAEEKEARREAAAARWTRLAVAGAALLALYFVLARVVRILVWRKGRTEADVAGDGRP